MENFARHHYENNVDQLVREELKQAGIPILELPCYMDTEVKTRYVGVLYGFFFYRAWTYWVCKGDMPLDIAEQIYRNYKGLRIRAGGHCGNVPPKTVSVNPVYIQELEDLLRKTQESDTEENYVSKYLEQSKSIIDNPNLPRFVRNYHIDTIEGLEKLAEVIKEKKIHTHLLSL